MRRQRLRTHTRSCVGHREQRERCRTDDTCSCSKGTPDAPAGAAVLTGRWTDALERDASARNADINVQTFPDNQIQVTGIHHDLHRTFNCSGSISHDFEPSETWHCEACDEDGTNCIACDIQQRTYCEP